MSALIAPTRIPFTTTSNGDEMQAAIGIGELEVAQLHFGLFPSSFQSISLRILNDPGRPGGRNASGLDFTLLLRIWGFLHLKFTLVFVPQVYFACPRGFQVLEYCITQLLIDYMPCIDLCLHLLSPLVEVAGNLSSDRHVPELGDQERPVHLQHRLQLPPRSNAGSECLKQPFELHRTVVLWHINSLKCNYCPWHGSLNSPHPTPQLVIESFPAPVNPGYGLLLPPPCLPVRHCEAPCLIHCLDHQ
ncbi:uncharacterized protein G2W53_015640 [Senna tora]|uniref:Uncharacterized protein n=1 Tax=Senna tora TaxID=362788 RepID=A0A834WW23_9FABA|nr:uncharacterized protein G2W53_015640 [Senna tora]